MFSHTGVRTRYAGTREAVTGVWQVWYENRMFNYFILIQGTEEEMEDYLYSEMGYVGRYRALPENEVRKARDLGTPIYRAPKINHI